MNATSTIAELRAQIRGLVAQLPPDERHEVIGDIWDDLAENHPDSIPIPEWQIQEVERRVSEYEANPTPGLTWDEVVARIHLKHGH